MNHWAAFLVVFDWASLQEIDEVMVSPVFADRLQAEHVTETAQNNPDIMSCHAEMKTKYPCALLCVRTKGIP
jgi:hypothetical protein